MFGNRYFAARYYPDRYFPQGESATTLYPPAYFPNNYFAKLYYAGRYFPPIGGSAPPVTPPAGITIFPSRIIRREPAIDLRRAMMEDEEIVIL